MEGQDLDSVGIHYRLFFGEFKLSHAANLQNLQHSGCLNVMKIVPKAHTHYSCIPQLMMWKSVKCSMKILFAA